MKPSLLLIRLTLPFLIILGLRELAFGNQKILVVVEANAYNATYVNLGKYIFDIQEYDNKKTELIIWNVTAGDNYTTCTEVRTRLHDEYVHAIDSGDVVEGAILIGNIPVPQTMYGQQLMPLDQVYMDLVDCTKGTPPRYADYPTTSPFPPNGCPYAEDIVDGNYFYSPFNSGYYLGDSHGEIWVSRINGQYLGDGIRYGLNVFDEYDIYNSYFMKADSRMSKPSNVPSRGFAMGGAWDLGTVHDNLGSTMLHLNLPWFAEFETGENSPYNWESQLLAGPRGCINFGACGGVGFSSERNRRYCVYTYLNTLYLGGDTTPVVPHQDVPSSDSLGWEWAGSFEHSLPEFSQFQSSYDYGPPLTNGRFYSGTLGPLWGSSYLRSGGPGAEYLYYQDTSSNPNPYNRPLGWKNKSVTWRWKPSDGTYNIYAYFVDGPNNCNYVEYYVKFATLDANGVPIAIATDYQSTAINQQTDTNGLASDPNWHMLFQNVPLSANQMVIVYSGADRGYHPDAPGGYITGDQIVSSIQFIEQTGTGVAQTIDATQPTPYLDVDNYPQGIFATNGCMTSDEMDRGYEDMTDEPGGGGYAKPQFYLIMGCQINNFVHTNPNTITDYMGEPGISNYGISKNLGNLYALGHNGLICMGTSTNNYSSDTYTPFVTDLASGQDFGQAFLDQQNNYWNSEDYCLLGAGNLRSKPYVQFGTYIQPVGTISNTQNTSTDAPILVQNVNVTGAGNWTVTSTNDANSPFGTNSTIDIRPECDFAPTGTNVVDFKAN